MTPLVFGVNYSANKPIEDYIIMGIEIRKHPDSVILTREELEELVSDAFIAGQNKEAQDRDGGGYKIRPDKQQYINSIIQVNHEPKSTRRDKRYS